MFTIFRPANLPDPEAFIEQWQDLAIRNGLKGIHFVAHLFDNEIDYPWRSLGYDGAVMTNELKLVRRRFWQVVGQRFRLVNDEKNRPRMSGKTVEAVGATGRLFKYRILQYLLNWPGCVHYYSDAMLFFKSKAALDLGCYPSLVPGWDNSARAGRRSVILHGSTPELFAAHVVDIVESVADRPEEDRIVFIKSWNEWAEGNYLEPDQKYGHAYLDVIKAAMKGATESEPALQQASATAC
jgi:hypothetical protein